MAKKPKATLGSRIAQARLTAGAQRGKSFTQTELAKAVGVTPATVSQWEAGASEPVLTTIAAIAKALDVSAGYLAFGEKCEPHSIPDSGTVFGRLQTVHTEPHSQKPK